MKLSRLLGSYEIPHYLISNPNMTNAYIFRPNGKNSFYLGLSEKDFSSLVKDQHEYYSYSQITSTMILKNLTEYYYNFAFDSKPISNTFLVFKEDIISLKNNKINIERDKTFFDYKLQISDNEFLTIMNDLTYCMISSIPRALVVIFYHLHESEDFQYFLNESSNIIEKLNNNTKKEFLYSIQKKFLKSDFVEASVSPFPKMVEENYNGWDFFNEEFKENLERCREIDAISYKEVHDQIIKSLNLFKQQYSPIRLILNKINEEVTKKI